MPPPRECRSPPLAFEFSPGLSQGVEGALHGPLRFQVPFPDVVAGVALRAGLVFYGVAGQVANDVQKRQVYGEVKVWDAATGK